MKRLVPALLLLCLLISADVAQESYVGEITRWRADHEKQLRSEDDWLTLAGLFWLKPGVNTIGAGRNYDVVLTKSFSGGKFGEIVLSENGALLTVAPGVRAISGEARTSTMT